jgi:OmpA-OmpF porin, OOP family
MTFPVFRLSALVAFALAVTIGADFTVPARAADSNELTEPELKQRFQSQRTRGLVIAPTDSAAPQTEVSNYVEFDRDEQVNIRISFDFDSSALREDQKPRLATLCNVMRDIDIERFRVVGHTDAVGDHAYNQRLSLMRAEEVKRYLVNECGIAEERLEATGVGPDFLYDPDDPRSPDNRRVEFQALS